MHPHATHGNLGIVLWSTFPRAYRLTPPCSPACHVRFPPLKTRASRCRALPAFLLLSLVLSALPFKAAHARIVYGADSRNGYEAFYAEQAHRAFTWPAYSQRNQAVRMIYVSEEEYGKERIEDPQIRFEIPLDDHAVDTRLAYDHIIVGDREFRYADAIVFEGETREPDHPMYAALHVAPARHAHPSLLCVESHSGDDDAAIDDDRIPLFLIIDPVSPQARLYRLPSLLSSCSAITVTPDGRISFPANRYVSDADGHLIGVRFHRYHLDEDRFVDSGHGVSATFVVPDDISRFTLDTH